MKKTPCYLKINGGLLIISVKEPGIYAYSSKSIRLKINRRCGYQYMPFKKDNDEKIRAHKEAKLKKIREAIKNA
jgi:hypothetical protein